VNTQKNLTLKTHEYRRPKNKTSSSEGGEKLKKFLRGRHLKRNFLDNNIQNNYS